MLLSGTIHNNDSRVLCEHDLIFVALVVFHRFDSFDFHVTHLELVSLVVIISDLMEVAPVQEQCIRVCWVYGCQFVPQVGHLLSTVNNVESQLVYHIQINHIRIKVRPELNVIGSRLFYSPFEFVEEILESDHNSHIQSSICMQLLIIAPH